MVNALMRLGHATECHFVQRLARTSERTLPLVASRVALLAS
ncbi:protein of unknown function (plasmid) [Shinella sp. WSC3-e]|nr:protein of unknown function [Shinella sp. WSC3-e]